MTRRRLLAGLALVVTAGVVLLLVLRRGEPPRAKASDGDRSGAGEPGSGSGAAPARQGRAPFRPKTAKEGTHVDTPVPSEHAAGIDRKLARITAMLKATGKTPCETAYNATLAEKEAAKQTGKDSIFTFVAERDEFLRLCESLPEAAKPCAVPLYATRNREYCRKHRPPDELLQRMFQIRPDKIDQDELELVVPRDEDEGSPPAETTEAPAAEAP